jgi:hypothetical protein
MSSLESIIAAVERGARAFLVALPFEARLVLACLLGFFTLARAARPVPLNSAFARRRDTRGVPAGSNAPGPDASQAPTPRLLRYR